MLRRRSLVLTLQVLLLWSNVVRGRETPSSADSLVLERGTPIRLQLAQTISSATLNKGDSVAFVVQRAVVLGGLTLVRAGSKVNGVVVDVQRRRLFGMGGNITIQISSVQASSGDTIGLGACLEFKGKSHIIRMAAAAAIVASIYLPATPALLLSRGRESIVLKGTEATAYTTNELLVDQQKFQIASRDASELQEMMQLLPPRVLNGEGREGDVLNLIFVASEQDLIAAFTRAGWLQVEKSKPQIIWHLAWERTHYMRLPMAALYVFGRAQDYSFALPDPTSIVARRHHLRLWYTGHTVSGVPLWVGAATHDVSIQFVRHKFQLFHRIDPNVDGERDFIAGNLSETTPTHEEYLQCEKRVFNAQTATGQSYYSDGRVLFIELSHESASANAYAAVRPKSGSSSLTEPPNVQDLPGRN
jgi:hypothetical protein